MKSKIGNLERITLYKDAPPIPHPNKSIKAFLEEHLKEVKERTRDAAAMEVLDLIEDSHRYMAKQARILAEMTEAVNTHKALLTKVSIAGRYGVETSNFLPLARILGHSIRPEIQKNLVEVPEGWKPKPNKPSLKYKVKRGISKLLQWLLKRVS